MLVHIKYKMEDFKTALLEILKQLEQWKKYKELFVEQQQKILTSNKNKDLGIFSQDATVNVIAEFDYIPEEEVTFCHISIHTKRTVPICQM